MPKKLTIQSMTPTEMAFQLLSGTTGLSCLVTMSTTLATLTTTITILVTVPPGVAVTMAPPLIAQTNFLHITELEAAISEVSRDSCLQTAI